MLPVLLLLGLGLDDCFVLTWDYHQQYLWMLYVWETTGEEQSYEECYPVVERIANTMAAGGYSIFITSLTDFMVFFIALNIAGMPIVYNFAFVCSVGVCFDYFFQVTFFVAFLTLDAYRQDAHIRDCCCCCGVKSEPPAKKMCSKEESDPFQTPFGIKLFGKIIPRYSLTIPGIVTILLLTFVLFVFSFLFFYSKC
eukprot:UN27479